MAERYQRQIDERSTPAAFGRAYGGPEAYGAGIGRAMQPLGDAIVKLAEYKKRRQDEWDAATVMNAQNEYMKRLAEWMDDPQNGQAANRQLGAARGLADDAFAYADALREKIDGQLENEAQKAAFGRIAEKAKLPFWKGASEFEARQVRAWQDQTFQTAMETSAELVTRAPGDAFALETAREQRRNAIRAKLFGADPSVVERAIVESDSELDARRISLIAQEDPVGALEMLRGENALLPEARAKLEAPLVREVERLEAQAQAEAERESVYTGADAYWNHFGTDEEAARAAMEADPNMTPEMRERVWSGYKAKLADRERWDRKREKDWTDGWLDKIANSQSMEEALSFIEASGADGVDRRRFEGYAAQVHKTGAFKEDIQDWAQAFSEVTSGQIATADEFLSRWRGRLSDGSLKSLYRTFFEGGGNGSGSGGSGGGDANARYIGFAYSDAVKNAMKSMGIRDDSSREAALFVTSLGEEVAAQEQKLGRKLSPLEKHKVLQDMAKVHVLSNNTIIHGYRYRMAQRAGFIDIPGQGMVREVRGADGTVTYEQFDPSAEYEPPMPEPRQPAAREPLPPLPDRNAPAQGTPAPATPPQKRVRMMADGTPFDRGRPTPTGAPMPGASSGSASRAANTGNLGNSGNIGKDMLGGKGTITGRFTDRRAYRNGQHNGLDVAAPEGTPVMAPDIGVTFKVSKVETHKPQTGYGNRVVLTGTLPNGSKIEISAAHMQNGSISLREGDTVGAGQVIGAVGNTGYTSSRGKGGNWFEGKKTGHHLDLKIKVNGKYVDPETYAFPRRNAASTAAAKSAPVQAAPVQAAPSKGKARGGIVAKDMYDMEDKIAEIVRKNPGADIEEIISKVRWADGSPVTDLHKRMMRETYRELKGGDAPAESPAEAAPAAAETEKKAKPALSTNARAIARAVREAAGKNGEISQKEYLRLRRAFDKDTLNRIMEQQGITIAGE